MRPRAVTSLEHPVLARCPGPRHPASGARQRAIRPGGSQSALSRPPPTTITSEPVIRCHLFPTAAAIRPCRRRDCELPFAIPCADCRGLFPHPCTVHVIRRLPGNVTISCKFFPRRPMHWHAACRNTHAHRRSIRCERSGPECWNRSCCGGLWSGKGHKKRNWRPAVIRNRGNPE